MNEQWVLRTYIDLGFKAEMCDQRGSDSMTDVENGEYVNYK